MQVLSGTPTRRENKPSKHGPTTSCMVCQEQVPQQVQRHRHACRSAMEAAPRTTQGGQTYYSLQSTTIKIALDNSQLIPLNSTSTRNTHDLFYKIPYCRIQYRQQSFPRTIKDWNSLHPDAMSAGTVESFRTHLSHPFI